MAVCRRRFVDRRCKARVERSFRIQKPRARLYGQPCHSQSARNGIRKDTGNVACAHFETHRGRAYEPREQRYRSDAAVSYEHDARYHRAGADTHRGRSHAFLLRLAARADDNLPRAARSGGMRTVLVVNPAHMGQIVAYIFKGGCGASRYLFGYPRGQGIRYGGEGGGALQKRVGSVSRYIPERGASLVESVAVAPLSHGDR